MIEVTIPDSFVPERTYAINILLGEFLGLEYHIHIDNKTRWIYLLTLENGKQLQVQDHFFSKIDAQDSYLQEKYLPEKIGLVQTPFNQGDDIPVLYGTDNIRIEADCIVCGIDLFASAFFMLSRWEEIVVKTRDMHQRFPAIASIAFKKDFLDRPIVDEYTWMLRQMLESLGCKQIFRQKDFQFVLTHDVDALLKYQDWPHVLRTALGDIIKRRQIPAAFTRIQEYRRICRKKMLDPFDHFDGLMDQAEAIGLKAHFFFMSGSSCEYDRRTPYPIHHPKTLAILHNIHQRGHIVGFHPGYRTFRDEDLWQEEREKIQSVWPYPLQIGRQHYLRFQVPDTWQIWENQQMTIDSTCGYADCEGFRCGTGKSFSVFNVLTRRQLKLKEQPLIFMEQRSSGTGGYDSISPFEHRMPEILRRAIALQTPVTLLFHNHVFVDKVFVGMYNDILKIQLYDKS